MLSSRARPARETRSGSFDRCCSRSTRPRCASRAWPRRCPTLAAPLTARGVDVTVDVEAGLQLPDRGRAAGVPHRAGGDPKRRLPRRRPHVSISVAQTNGTVSLRVTDDGRGFDESELAAHDGPRATWASPCCATWRRPPAAQLAITSAPGSRDDGRAGGPDAMIRVAVIDDHAIVRNGLVQLLGVRSGARGRRHRGRRRSGGRAVPRAPPGRRV